LLEGQDDEPTVEDIKAADRMAFDMLSRDGASDCHMDIMNAPTESVP
jgi:hypothetical protein